MRTLVAARAARFVRGWLWRLWLKYDPTMVCPACDETLNTKGHEARVDFVAYHAMCLEYPPGVVREAVGLSHDD